MKEHRENFNKEKKHTRKKLSELKNVTEIKSKLEGINSRLVGMEQISNVKDTVVEIIPSEQQKEKI